MATLLVANGAFSGNMITGVAVRSPRTLVNIGRNRMRVACHKSQSVESVRPMRRGVLGSVGMTGAALALSSFTKDEAKAIGGSTPTAAVEVTGWEDIGCPEGSPPKMRCIRVYGKINNKNQKTAANSEVYGYVEYDDGNPALWNDDVKRIANIADIKPGMNDISFTLSLRKLAGLTGKEDVIFKKLTARMYFSNFYSAKPLGEVECDELDSADCEESL
eukprot:CAMPEP_0167747254 /NCGR_PEP_ID=MMETSP0110_2-20121227/4179_1 /TAXON_ID=629695 /ORGANISM="Gymnochlora sp., Strain CCMP2014" /LENGTH=217 /DNA_ID=CAMNT_0007632135 /DNA_START=52 /DNA_END=705 /DNA_ORIENTATION=+